jgi:3-phenylpropionate/trans-cinnamate dioxygenase ferredoxin subunit
MTDFSRPGLEFVAVLPLALLREGSVVPVEVNGRPVALYLLEGKPYCTEDLCTHEFASLSEAGCVDGDEVECGEHGACFNIKTGAVTRTPAVGAIRSFPALVRDGQVWVALD